MGKDKLGQVLVDAPTAKAASLVYRFRPLGRMLELKGVREPVQAYYPISYARRRLLSTVGSKEGRRIVGRDREVELCLSNWGLGDLSQVTESKRSKAVDEAENALNLSLLGSPSDLAKPKKPKHPRLEHEDHFYDHSDQGGRCVAIVSPSGFGKTALLQNLGQIAALDLGATTIFSAGSQERVSTPFYPWRKVIAKLLARCFSSRCLGGSNVFPPRLLESADNLFDACKSAGSQDGQEKDEGNGNSPAPGCSAASDSEEDCKEFVQELLTRPLWRDRIDLLVLVFPFLVNPLASAGWDGTNEGKRTEVDSPLDGMLCSENVFKRLADLIVTTVRAERRRSVVAASKDSGSKCLLVLDDVDLFDRHSLLLLYFLMRKEQAVNSEMPNSHLPNGMSIVVSSTGPRMSDPSNYSSLALSSSAAMTSSASSLLDVASDNQRAFPFPSLNFRRERQDFLQNRVFSGAFVHNLQSISVSNAMAVFESIFDQRFDDTVASKTMALSAGNLTVARSFLEKCLDPPRSESGGCHVGPYVCSVTNYAYSS